MHPMAVCTYRALMPDGRPVSFIDRDINPMPGKVVKVETVGRQAVFTHQFLVSMTAGAQFRGLNAKLRSARVLDIVHTVTVGTHRHIRIILLDQRPAVEAGLVSTKIAVWH